MSLLRLKLSRSIITTARWLSPRGGSVKRLLTALVNARVQQAGEGILLGAKSIRSMVREMPQIQRGCRRVGRRVSHHNVTAAVNVPANPPVITPAALG